MRAYEQTEEEVLLDDLHIPEKLLDAPVLDTVWPEAFNDLGHGLRLDYTTDLHSPDGAPQGYKHRFTTGVKAYWPFQDLSDLDEGFGGKPHRLPEPPNPIMLGYDIASADRVYIVTRDGRQMIFVRKGLDVEPNDRNESFIVSTLDPSVVAWDPDNLQLLITPKGRREPLFVFKGGGLNLVESAMVVG